MLTLLAFFLIDEDPTRIEALKQTAKAFWGVTLTHEQARELDIGAQFGAMVADDPAIKADDLHGIAGHESRWTNAVTHEVNGKGQWIGDSCGVMTPFDTYYRQCMPWELTFAGGYVAGALHLKVWVDECRRLNTLERDVRVCALNGYAGRSWDLQVRGQMTWQTFVGFSDKLAAAVLWRRRTRDIPKS